ncbi:MAG: DUF1932 domain-containing protein [Burkholderiales bacterium]
MTTVVAVIAAGEMGSVIGGRMALNGARVLTSLSGRGAKSAARAARMGMVDAADATVAGAEYLLSVVPPGDAMGLAQRLLPALRASATKPVYVDCNAKSLETSAAIGELVAASGARYVDACIIGHPGEPEKPGPAVYLSGEHPSDLAALAALGLRMRSTGSAAGSASALKMAYAGLNKGLTGLAAAMAIAATRSGAARAMIEEMSASQPQLLAHVCRTLPDMYSKAYRWDFEMQEVARFAGADKELAQLYGGMAALFARLGRDWEGSRVDIAAIDAFVAQAKK